MKAGIVLRAIAFVVMAVALALCVHDRLLDAPTERVDSDLAEASSAAPARGRATPKVVRMQVGDRESVRVRVTDEAGQALDGMLVGDGVEYAIEGSGLVPPRIGKMRVLVPGFVPRTVDIDEADVECVLERGNVLSGVCLDARTGRGVSGVEIEVRGVVDDMLAFGGATGSDGRFQSPALPDGDYIVRGRADGYLPVSDGPHASLPGIRVTHPAVSRDTRLVMYPIFVGIVTVINETNLDPGVFRGLLVSRSRAVPGIPLPAVHGREIAQWIVGMAKEQGSEFWYAETCLVDGFDAILTASVDFELMGEACGAAAVTYRPWAEVREKPAPDVFVLRGAWECETVEVDTPLPLVVTRAVPGILFGGIECAAGVTRLSLPLGQYWLRPPDLLSLVDKAQWSRQIDIPSDRHVRMGETAEFGTLSLAMLDVPSSGFVTITGRRGEVGVALHAIPCDVPASPGRYQVVLHAGHADELTVRWRQTVEVMSGETKRVVIGEKR